MDDQPPFQATERESTVGDPDNACGEGMVEYRKIAELADQAEDLDAAAPARRDRRRGRAPRPRTSSSRRG